MTVVVQGAVSATRARKNLAWLQANAPQVFKGPEPVQGWMSAIPVSLLSGVHREVPASTSAPLDLRELAKVKMPVVRVPATFAMFSGTFHVVQVNFQTPGGLVQVSAADVTTALAYATLAAPQISAYCSQYGASQLAVSQTVLSFSVTLAGTTYSDGDLRGWVSEIVSQNGLSADTDALLILNPPALTNTDGDRAQGVGGYHDHHGSAPYAFVNVNGSGLTVLDGARVYANTLSHEMAELTVDPQADDRNPEVCDPCAGNCKNLFLNFFDGNGAYLGSSTGAAPAGSVFFIAAIVKPSSSGACPAPQSDCAYPPPGWQAWTPIGVQTFAQPTRVLGLARTPDDVDLFGIAPDGQVYTAWWRTGQAWAGWAVPAGGTFQPDTPLTGISRDPLMVDLFAVGQDGNAYTAWWRGDNGWSGFAGFASGNFSQGTPLTPLARGEDSVDVFAVGQDGAAYTAWWRGSTWSGFASFVPGNFPQRTPISAVSKDGSGVDLFAVGQDGQVYTAWWRGGNWSGFASFVPGNFPQRTAIATVAKDSNSVDLFAIGEDGAAYTAWWRAGAGWKGFSPFVSGSFTVGTPITAISRGSSSVDLFAVGQDGRVYTAWWRGQGWAGFAPILPYGTFQQATPVTAVAHGSDALDLYAVGQDGHVYMARWPMP